ncbi:YqiA/YcfP family alpha/beta fold hydrolase [Leptolyngbya sp. NIES-2104]|uniref:YqiA/YcfP family alpha/beta fold hydrolase n=1 Tax=Leptolyngbya sp. NIES-2104 TaxID=1552121 RepID=UPI00073F44A6|nr:YqiA/YcfP family alpha/beta fold hydrolase [Leptolyngbya sp. NIES-2104]
MKYFYLHGFASSPRSTKARQLRDRFQSLHLSLEIPDFNQNDFQHLTLTRQVEQVKSLISEGPITLIGSSFDGLTAAWIAQQCEQVDRIVLLAPAFNYLNHWLPTFAPAQLEKWRSGQAIMIYQYGTGGSLPLNYDIISDLERYDENELQKPIPTLVVHGIRDETIPIEQSRSYARARSWVELIELDSDHSLVDQEESIWQAIQEFCDL